MTDFADNLSRRDFLKLTAKGFALLGLGPFILSATKSTQKKFPDLVVVQGRDPSKTVRKAIDAFGGLRRFIRPGAVVVVKPNIGWDRLPQLGANTNPEVVKTIVELAFKAGARKVKVFDNTVNNPRTTYRRSGIMEKAKEAGASVVFINPKHFVKHRFPRGRFLKEWLVYRDVLECDCLINVPVAKTHSISTLTIGIKNLMGVVGGNRGKWHPQIHQALADLITEIRPTLTVVDAFRIMVRNGPSGGSPSDLKVVRRCIVGSDPVAVDAYTATLFGIRPESIGYLRLASQAGVGVIDLKRLNIRELKV